MTADGSTAAPPSVTDDDRERTVRDAYRAGWYAADCDEGKGGAESPESEDEVVARLLQSADPGQS